MPSITNVAAIAACDAVVDLVDVGSADLNGDLVIYDATGGVPATVEDAITTQVTLTRVELQDPAFSAAIDGAPGGVASLLGVPLSDLAIDATGTAAFARIHDRDNNAVMQLTVTVVGGGGELQLNSVALQVGATFTIVSGTITMPEA